MNDMISRQAAMAYPLSWEHYDKEHGDMKFICGVESYREYIEHLPSAEPKTGRDCTNFVRWLMDEVMDEENWQLNAVANGEIICRKLKKLGLLDVVDGYYVETQETGERMVKHETN